MKYITIFAATLLFASCTENTTETTTDANAGQEQNAIAEETPEVEVYDYAADWGVFKDAIINRDKKTVLTFVSNEDQNLQDAIDLTYDYTFDETFIEKIKKTEYTDLVAENSGELQFDFTIDYITDVDGVAMESSITLVFEKTPHGLRIVEQIMAG